MGFFLLIYKAGFILLVWNRNVLLFCCCESEGFKYLKSLHKFGVREQCLLKSHKPRRGGASKSSWIMQKSKKLYCTITKNAKNERCMQAQFASLIQTSESVFSRHCFVFIYGYATPPHIRCLGSRLKTGVCYSHCKLQANAF